MTGTYVNRPHVVDTQIYVMPFSLFSKAVQLEVHSLHRVLSSHIFSRKPPASLCTVSYCEHLFYHYFCYFHSLF